MAEIGQKQTCLLLNSKASVNCYGLASDETGAWTTQPKYCGGDFVGTAEASYWNCRYYRVHGLWFVSQRLLDHGRVDGAGTDRIDPNAPCCVLESRRPGQADHAVF
jgi:hypothetical protein